MFDKYIKLIPKGIKNFDRIAKGIINNVKFNHGNMSEEEQEEIIKRRLICITCPFNSDNARTSQEYKDLNGGQTYKDDSVGLHCSLCACNIHWKTAVLEEKCGLSYYNDTHPDNKQELKWDAFKNENDGQQIKREEENSDQGTSSV